MIRPNDRGQVHIIYIMLSRVDNYSPTLPPTLFFSVKEQKHPLCPPIF